MALEAGGHDLTLTLEDPLRGVLALGLLEATGVRLGPAPAAFEAECARVCDHLAAEHAHRPPSDIPGVNEVRALFHRLGVDPTKTRPSSEALLRRVVQGKGLPRVNLVVDVCNLCSLEHQLPLGLYDRRFVKGAVQARAGGEGEGYAGIRKQRVNVAGRLMLADDEGPFGAPTSDSARTAITSATTEVLVVVFCPVERAEALLSTMLEHVADRLTRHASARVVAVRVIR
ncbi:MAG TPA: phenylalanine--tRNA ligase beta subunit-related protein [Terriglobales bacterium]|nr:phenylalanine--tRNA ligase beta subunit-related protein [Terriglobales bacterium]